MFGCKHREEKKYPDKYDRKLRSKHIYTEKYWGNGHWKTKHLPKGGKNSYWTNRKEQIEITYVWIYARCARQIRCPQNQADFFYVDVDSERKRQGEREMAKEKGSEWVRELRNGEKDEENTASWPLE